MALNASKPEKTEENRTNLNLNSMRTVCGFKYRDVYLPKKEKSWMGGERKDVSGAFPGVG